MPTFSEILRSVAPNAKSNYVDGFTNSQDLLFQFGINTPLRISHFLAQVLHETGGGTVLFENLSYTTPARLLQIFGIGHHSAAIRPEEIDGLIGNPQALAERVYGLGNPRKARELGNTRPGDGYRYRGAGALQTTGGANYKKMGDLSGVDFYGQPDLIVDPAHVLKPAIHEWDLGKLNAAADKNDIRTITRVINGGYNGITERQAWFDRIWRRANATDTPPDPSQVAKPDTSTRWLQQALNDLGYQPKLTVDGRYGSQTTTAVKWFQGLANVTVDGVAGDVTRAAIKLRLAAIRAA
jgi:putative chitinase